MQQIKDKTNRLKDISILLGCVILCEMIGIAGSLFTAPAIPTWYAGLAKPAFNPPSWVFGPAWGTLYLLMGIAFYLVLRSSPRNEKRTAAIKVFIIQLVLNGLWTPLFFGLKKPLWAFIEIVLLWVAIILTIHLFLRVSRAAAVLMIPYLGWVSFAAILNLSIFLLNLGGS